MGLGFDIFAHDIGSTGLSLESLQGYDEDFLLGDGRPLLATYPKKKPVFPWKNAGLLRGPRKPAKTAPFFVDVFDSLEGVLVVSERCRAIVAAHDSEVEALPVTMKGEKAPYFMLNVLAPVPCKGVKKATIESGKPAVVGKNLKSSQLPAKRAFLQVAESSVYLARRDLCEALVAAGITGFETTPLRD